MTNMTDMSHIMSYLRMDMSPTVAVDLCLVRDVGMSPQAVALLRNCKTERAVIRSLDRAKEATKAHNEEYADLTGDSDQTCP